MTRVEIVGHPMLLETDGFGPWGPDRRPVLFAWRAWFGTPASCGEDTLEVLAVRYAHQAPEGL